MPEDTLWTNPGEGVPFERIRHPLRTRSLSVHAIADITPQMRRITFAGNELADFASLGFDDHIKIVFPVAVGDSVRRDYTPRRHDRSARLLTVDFALHESGPASDWARQATLGDRLDIAGPKGSAIVSPQVRNWLLVGDETALPAIGRRIEEASPGTRITSVLAVAGPGEEQTFVTHADLASIWAHRPKALAADPAALMAAVRMVELQPQTFIWIAAEARVARAVRDYLADQQGHPRNWIKAAGYWVAGRADAHEKFA